MRCRVQHRVGIAVGGFARGVPAQTPLIEHDVELLAMRTPHVGHERLSCLVALADLHARHVVPDAGELRLPRSAGRASSMTGGCVQPARDEHSRQASRRRHPRSGTGSASACAADRRARLRRARTASPERAPGSARRSRPIRSSAREHAAAFCSRAVAVSHRALFAKRQRRRRATRRARCQARQMSLAGVTARPSTCSGAM